MSGSDSGPLRHVPSDTCPRCGTHVNPDQGLYVLQNSDAEHTDTDQEGTSETGNLCPDCFDDVVIFVHGEG